jgi:flagellar hook-associated protein 2
MGTLHGTAATGSGQTLTGATGTPAEGLKVSVPAGALGDRGTVTYGTGFAYRLNELLTKLVGDEGAIAVRTKGLNDDITALGKRKDALEARLALVEKNYRAQFNALDTLLASMNTTSTYLAQQLANLPKIGDE